jgi:hypothetical protein
VTLVTHTPYQHIPTPPSGTDLLHLIAHKLTSPSSSLCRLISAPHRPPANPHSAPISV